MHGTNMKIFKVCVFYSNMNIIKELKFKEIGIVV